MFSKTILAANALICGVHGFILLFAADEFISLLKLNEMTSVLQLQLQFLGIVLLSLGILNWMSKGQMMGGIYGRPVISANILHSVAGAILLGKFILNGHVHFLFNILFVVYLVFSVLFGKLLYSHPQKS